MERNKSRILVVDDAPENIRILSGTLSRAYTILAAKNGAMALQIAGSDNPPDLILLDIMMPGMDGFSVCEILKKDDRTRSIPVIFLTAADQIERKTRGFTLGAVDYIIKPFEIQEVEARVRTHIALVEARRTLERLNRELLESAKLKEDVENITRHDLKGPLNGIIGIPQLMLLDDNLNGEQREYLETIRECGRKMLRLINISLDLFKMERNLYALSPKEVNIVMVLHHVRQELQPLADGSALKIRILVDGRNSKKEDRKTILGEELLCYSLFSNLLKNSIEASPPNEPILVHVRGEKNVEIRITNRGEVPEAIRGSFFQKYATHGKEGGTGLGAYSAKLMTNTLGGSIVLDSSKRGHTSILVKLPGRVSKS